MSRNVLGAVLLLLAAHGCSTGGDPANEAGSSAPADSRDDCIAQCELLYNDELYRCEMAPANWSCYRWAQNTYRACQAACPDLAR